MNARSIAVAATALWLMGCGGDDPMASPPVPTATDVVVSPAETRLEAFGATVRLSAVVRDQNGQVMTVAVTWTRSDAAVATVGTDGLVTAVGNGTTTITATAGGASGSAAVTVAQEVSAVSVLPAADTLALGDILRLAAEAADANDNQVGDAVFSWESGDSAVVTVDANGLVTAVGEGTATITATAGGVSGSAAVTVANLDPAVLRDRAALSALFEATNGPNWINSGNWRTAAPLAEWYGVSTDASGRVTGLGLGRNDLSGPIPPELGSLASLRQLFLDGNALAGPLPQSLLKIDGLNQLQILPNAGLCVRATDEFVTWLRRIDNRDDESESLCNGAGATAWVPPPVADPYPIRLHWGECPINYRYEGCVPVDNPRERWGGRPACGWRGVRRGAVVQGAASDAARHVGGATRGVGQQLAEQEHASASVGNYARRHDCPWPRCIRHGHYQRGGLRLDMRHGVGRAAARGPLGGGSNGTLGRGLQDAEPGLDVAPRVGPCDCHERHGQTRVEG